MEVHRPEKNSKHIYAFDDVSSPAKAAEVSQALAGM
jgi:hypothetical protein